MTDEPKHTIRIGEFKIPKTPASHIVITGHDEFGNQIWEMNGLSTDRLGNIIPMGKPWDTTDKIKGYNEDYPSFGGRLVNQTVIVVGTPEEIVEFRERGKRVIDQINRLDLGYLVLDQNSNSVAGTILRSFGITPQQLLNSSKFRFLRPVPGFTRNLLTDFVKDVSPATGMQHRGKPEEPAEHIHQEDNSNLATEDDRGNRAPGTSREPAQRRPIVIPPSTFNLFSDLTTMTTAAMEGDRQEGQLAYDDLTDGEAYRVLTDGAGQVASRFEPRGRPDLDEAQTDDDVTRHGGGRFVPDRPAGL